MRFDFTLFELYLAVGIIGWPGALILTFIFLALGFYVAKRWHSRLVCFLLALLCAFPIIYLKFLEI
ncbi:hypothetical protein AAIB41_06195 [Brucella sp. BE17]|uniref:hypothetical protein n=1 Tax=Brucella sp. BE17 TaxID=3142977 RepID=UPI0031BACE80